MTSLITGEVVCPFQSSEDPRRAPGLKATCECKVMCKCEGWFRILDNKFKRNYFQFDPSERRTSDVIPKNEIWLKMVYVCSNTYNEFITYLQLHLLTTTQTQSSLFHYYFSSFSILFICRLLVIYFIVCFLLGNSPASQFCMPTFRNTLFVPFS